MPKIVVDVFVLVSLFAPLMLAVFAGREAAALEASVLTMGWQWQALFLATLALPVFALRRLQLLSAPAKVPSIME